MFQRLKIFKEILDGFNAEIIVVRHGVGNISHQTICKYDNYKNIIFIEKDINTGYEATSIEKRIGFGEMI